MEENKAKCPLSKDTLWTTYLPGEEIVITGISGVFSKSKNVQQFQDNLFKKVNMVEPNTRWKSNHPEIPPWLGALPEIDRYDAGYFGVHERQSHSLDVQYRILQEKTVEAIFDAGLNPSDLENTRTGVFVGISTCESIKPWLQSTSSQSYALTGFPYSMAANRLSYFLKLKGPSRSLESACSSSLYAVEDAFKAIRLGEIDNAIVGATNMCLNPCYSLKLARLGVLSKDGCSKSFDNSADGYVRAEAIAVILLQRSKNAKRIYAQIVHAKTNCGGHTQQGLGFPLRDGQKLLYKEFYQECGVDPHRLSFLEAHGTGTIAGDPEECGGIDEVFTKNRTMPLLIGSLKSNCGHTEPASGLCGIIKCVFGMETGLIPPNLHYSTPRIEIKGLVEERLKVVTEATPLKSDSEVLMAINSFGLGGANGHVLLKWNPKKKMNYGLPKDNLPRLVCVSGRTAEAVTSLLEDISTNTFDVEFIKLLHDIFRKNIQNHLHRGYTVVLKSGEIFRSLKYWSQNCKPLHIVFGELHNWWEMGNHLMALPIFADSIRMIEDYIPRSEVNISNTLLSRAPNKFLPNVVGSIAVQMGIISILNSLEIRAISSVGYSHGVLVSAYYDGLLTLQEIIKCAFVLEEIIKNINHVPSHKSYQQSHQEVTANDNNNALNGYELGLDKFEVALKASKLAAISQSQHSLIEILNKFGMFNSEDLKNKYKLTNYVINALTKNYLQNTECKKLNSRVLKIGDSSFTNNTDSCVFSFPIFEEVNYLEQFLKILGNLYECGYNLQISKLYPSVELPVSRGTRMISPCIKWKHDRHFFFPDYNTDEKIQAQSGVRVVTVQLSDEQWSYIDGHVIDGRILFPATGYLYLVWETYKIMNEVNSEKHIILENCKFLRATIVPKDEIVEFIITIQKGNGNFEVVEGQSIIVTGRIYVTEDEEKTDMNHWDDVVDNKSPYLPLKTKDIYKEFRLRGYYYKGPFCAIQECDNHITKAYIKWENNWVTFLDNMLQMKILVMDTRLLFVPVCISKISINAKRHLEWIDTEYINQGKASVLPVIKNKESGSFRCGGIFISGLVINPIPRKKNILTPVLESYKFVPNYSILNTQESVKVNTQIIIENSFIRKVKVVEVIDEFTKKDTVPLVPIFNSVFEDQILIQVYSRILSKTALDVTVDVEDKDLRSEIDCHLVIASNMLGRPQILNKAFSSLKENGFIISRESKEFDVSNYTCSGITIFTMHSTETETLVLFQKQSESKQPNYIKINSDNFSWISKVKEAIRKNVNQDIVLYSIHEPNCGILGLISSLRKEPECENIRCLFLIDKVQGTGIKVYESQLKRNMAVNVFKNGEWGTYRYLPLETPSLVDSEHCFVNVIGKGNLSSLRWAEGCLRHNMATPPETELIYVHYAALNFVDVMTASGISYVDFGERVRQDRSPGREFSGRDTRGNRVCGVISQGAISSLALTDSYSIFKIPDTWSLEEAATVPVVFLTVIYFVIIRGQLKKGETMLIHDGTGGLGQAAIQLALHYGCTVYSTVDSEAKRGLLKEIYPQLGDHQIGNYHDESFEQMIYKETNGRGVDLVLNTLAEDKLLASVRCLAKGGRFIEIGNHDLTNNKDLSLLLFQKEASFHGGALDQLYKTPYLRTEGNTTMLDGIKCGAVKPLNRKIFKFEEVEEAFKFIASAKHEGKVLIQIRESENDSSIQKFPGIARYFCNPEKTYVIVGGLGGMGLELADWLVLRGARRLVLTNRKGISTGYQDYRIRIWRSYGTIVKTSKAVVSTRAGCKELIEESLRLGPVDAIFNLGMVLVDLLLENQTPESFTAAFEPKAFTTEYLDELTRIMCPDLSEFVVFSSAISGRGNPGQTNYSMANSVMERICEKRKQDGYPALAIQWGAVGEVGILTEIYEEHTDLTINGYSMQHISSCLQVLETFLKQKDATIVSSVVVGKKRKITLSNNIIDSVTTILGISDAKSVSLHSTLAELGLDSMTTVEIRQTLERQYRVFLTPKEIRTITLTRLKEMSKEKHGTRQTMQEFEKLLKLVGSELESGLPYVTLMNSKADERPSASKLILFPGLEGFATVFGALTAHLNADTVCIQLKNDTEDQAIISVAKSLVPLVKDHLEKDEPFRVMAYSYETLVALEVVHILESQSYNGTAICIDGAPLLFKEVLKSLNLESKEMFETSLVSHFLSMYVPWEVISRQTEPSDYSLLSHCSLMGLLCILPFLLLQYTATMDSLLKCKSWEERVNLGVEVTENHHAFKRDHQKMVWNGIYNRIQSIIAYNPTYDKLKSTVKLYKPTQLLMQGLPEDYGLSSFSEKPVEVQVFEGDHSTILESRDLAKQLIHVL